jgi:hypothetical protein
MQLQGNKAAVAAGATITLTFPAGALPSWRVEVYSIDIRLINGTVTAVAAGAILTITSTHLGGLNFDCSNAMAAWADRIVASHDWDKANALKADQPGVSPTIVLPTAPAGCYWQWNIGYDVVPA